MDKAKQVTASIVLLNNRLHFRGTVDENEPISIDYTPPLGDNQGYTSLELFLLSFSTCVGSAVLTFLRKMNKTINAFNIDSTGIRREIHPTGFKSVHLAIELDSPDTTEAEFNKVLKLAEDTYCPLWAMIKGNVEVEVSLKIVVNSEVN